MKNKTRSMFSALLGLGLFLVPAASRAAVFQYDATTPTQASGDGFVNSILTTYDDATHQLQWNASISNNNGAIANAFWLVLSNGPNPKGISDQLPIYYFDASASFDSSGSYTGIAPTLTAYGYNGQDAGNSFLTPGVGLLSSLNSTWSASNSVFASGNASARSFSFTLDTTALDDASLVGSAYASAGQAFNSANWEGSGFGSQIGIWFHAVDGGAASPAYNGSGYLTSFPIANQSYVDSAYCGTVAVPEPGSALLVALAGLVLVHRRPRRLRA